MTKKIILSVFLVLLIVSGVFAAQFDLDKTEQIKEKIKVKGISEENIESITPIDFNDLPEEISIEKTDDTNLEIYKVEQKNEKPIFAITSGSLSPKIDSKKVYSRNFLNFGFAGNTKESVFLKTSLGVSGDLNKGYVMMRKGSITGISTNMEVIDSNNSESIEIVIYKNGQQLGFRNSIYSGEGLRKDYDIQSEGIANFEPGDVISVYVKTPFDVEWKDAITIIEVTSIE